MFPAPAPDDAFDAEHVVALGAVELAAQTFGRPGDPTVVLVHGACASMLWWDEELCRRIAAGGRHVVRYDNRDTGRSTTWPPGAPGYGLRDMGEDVVGILDALAVERAHLVGRSMAGAIVGAAAVAHPDRVETLTFVGTTPGDDDLPPMTEAFLLAVPDGPPPDDPEAAVDHIVAVQAAYAGGPFDADAARAVATRDVARSRDLMATMTNHFAIDLEAPTADEVAALGRPTLVVHGDRDPVWPIEHAHALVHHHRGAYLLVLPDTGHEMPRRTWPTFVDHLLRHTEPRKDLP